MRIAASWLDPAVGSTEYKGVARDLCAHCGQARLSLGWAPLRLEQKNKKGKKMTVVEN